jgi:hypothetical protein
VTEEELTCPHCLEVNGPASVTCTRCGGPLLPIATVGPYEQIQTQGFAMREAVTRPRRLVVVVGIWLLNLPALLFGVIEAVRNPDAALVFLPFVLLPGFLIFKTTRNYLKHRAANSPEAEPER